MKPLVRICRIWSQWYWTRKWVSSLSKVRSDIIAVVLFGKQLVLKNESLLIIKDL